LSLFYCVYRKVIFRLGSGKDIFSAAESISLERKEFIGKLKTGEAIVKVGKLNPFLVQVPLAGVEKGRADLPLKSRFPSSGERIYPIYPSDKLSLKERRFLQDVSQDPLSPITKRYSRLGINPKTGNRMKEKFIEAGLIKEVAVKDGRKIVLLELTSKGSLALGLNPRKGWRKGGAEHQYWVKKTMEHYKGRGYQVREEVAIGEGKMVDVVAEKDGRKIAIEVETGKSDVKKNIKNCLKAGFDEVLVLKTNEKAITHRYRNLKLFDPKESDVQTE